MILGKKWIGSFKLKVAGYKIKMMRFKLMILKNKVWIVRFKVKSARYKLKILKEKSELWNSFWIFLDRSKNWIVKLVLKMLRDKKSLKIHLIFLIFLFCSRNKKPQNCKGKSQHTGFISHNSDVFPQSLVTKVTITFEFFLHSGNGLPSKVWNDMLHGSQLAYVFLHTQTE